MNVTRSIAALRSALNDERRAGRVIGFVPTMGYLHEGHLSLIDVAREKGADVVVVSIFVNPLQFGPGEDFERYPRSEERDRQLLESRNVDSVFAPTSEEIYPPGSATRLTVAGVALPLEGERRPGHFDGVATVVCKLFHIVQPDLAVFGQKDAQQFAVIQQMVRDLDLPVDLHSAPTVRENDGLALSSRNVYLTTEQRSLATLLHASLTAGKNSLIANGRDIDESERAMLKVSAGAEQVTVDYLRVVDPATFLRPASEATELLLVGAVRLGRTRLIDNLRLE